MADTTAGIPADDEAMNGAVLIRTGRRARPDRAVTRVPIQEGNGASANGDAAQDDDEQADLEAFLEDATLAARDVLGHDAAPSMHDDVDGHDSADFDAQMSAAVDTRLLRERLMRLHDLAGEELQRRRAAAELEPAVSAPVPIHKLSSLSREVPRLARSMPQAAAEVLGAARGEEFRHLLQGAASFLSRQAEIAARHGRGDTSVDEFGFDREWTESLLPLFRFLYTNYWRVQTAGLQNVPGDGPALLVSNHAGVLPFDGAMIRTAIWDEHVQPRHARALIMDAFFGVPFISWFLRRTGNTLAHPDDAERLLERDELVLVFPEGVKGTGKPYRERYRLRRFGRGGFVQIALRTGAPIIPVSVVGSEELYPMLADVGPIARMIGMPYFPITPTFPLLGPLGLAPLPSSWIIEFHEPIPVEAFGADAAEDPGVVMRLTDQVRDVIQDGLYRNLERRGSTFA
ncbi:MAG TPA: lysophospholipid acyltransferase family protein [Candidatus Dormibacteraeota bacterium]|nr:lysophospholipid acyltransferase family protein [Candidatus Dormibacteraeota bacterium]